MFSKECCRTCKHCGVGQDAACGWCSIRKLSLHKELTTFFACHHWTEREPSLPNFHEKERESFEGYQLELGRTLVGSTSQDHLFNEN